MKRINNQLWTDRSFIGKIIKNENIVNLSELHNLNDWDKNHNYVEAYLFTKFLFDKFGKEKMMEFMTNLNLRIEYCDFQLSFKNQFREDLENLFNDWKNR